MKRNQTPDMKFKDVAVFGQKILDTQEGIVEAFVSGIGNKDSVDDIIQPGAFDESIAAMKPKGVWSHDWTRPVSKTLEIYEVPAGDSRLPTKMKTAGIGGLYVKTQFNLETRDGADAFSWVKFYGEESEWSIGYQTLDEEWDKKQKANLLNKVKLFEYSPVLFGANPLTATVGVKVHIVSNSEDDEVKIKIEGVEGEKAEALEALIKSAIESGDLPADDASSEDDEEIVVEEGKAADSDELETTDPEVEADEKDADTPEVVEEAKSEDEDTETAGDEAPEDDEAAPEGDDEAAETDEDDTAEEKAINPLVESFMTYAEKAEFDRNEVKTLVKFISDRAVSPDDEKTIQGSVEARLQTLNDSLMEQFGERDVYVYVYATFDATLIYREYDYAEGGAEFYEVSYSVSEDGEVEFGEAKQVEIIEVVMAKHAVMEAAFKGHSELIKSILAPFVDVSESSSPDPDVKSAIIDGIEAKAGRKLSKKTRDLIENAADALQKVLEGDAPEDAEEKAEDEELLETKDAETPEVTGDEETAGQELESDEEKAYVVDEDELKELQALAAQYLKETSDSD